MHQVCVHLRRRNGARPYFCDINGRNYRVRNNFVNYWHHILYVSEGSNHWQRLEREISFLNCLFVYIIIIFFAIRISRIFSSYYFCYPHFLIRIRYPQVSGPRFTDTPLAGMRCSDYCINHNYQAYSYINGNKKNAYLIKLSFQCNNLILQQKI